jgi:hypothetical protein
VGTVTIADPKPSRSAAARDKTRRSAHWPDHRDSRNDAVSGEAVEVALAVAAAFAATDGEPLAAGEVGLEPGAGFAAEGLEGDREGDFEDAGSGVRSLCGLRLRVLLGLLLRVLLGLRLRLRLRLLDSPRSSADETAPSVKKNAASAHPRYSPSNFTR